LVEGVSSIDRLYWIVISKAGTRYVDLFTALSGFIPESSKEWSEILKDA
jgi:hypothetical protein